MSKKRQHTQNEKIEVIHEGEEKAYSDDGVDLTMIRWMLSLTPTERLQHLQQHINTIMRLQGGNTEK